MNEEGGVYFFDKFFVKESGSGSQSAFHSGVVASVSKLLYTMPHQNVKLLGPCFSGLIGFYAQGQAKYPDVWKQLKNVVSENKNALQSYTGSD